MINLTAFIWPRFLNDSDRTGGLKLFNGLGRINSFILLRERPVQRQSVPGLGRRMNSGVTLRGLSAWAAAVVVAVIFMLSTAGIQGGFLQTLDSKELTLLVREDVWHLVHGLARGLGINVGVNATDGRAVVADNVPGHYVAYAGILQQAGGSVAEAVEAEGVLRMADAIALAGDRRFSRCGKPGGDEDVVELLGQAPVVPAIVILLAGTRKQGLLRIVAS